MVIRVQVLEMGIVVHSVVIGLSMGASQIPAAFGLWSLLSASISFSKEWASEAASSR